MGKIKKMYDVTLEETVVRHIPVSADSADEAGRTVLGMTETEEGLDIIRDCLPETEAGGWKVRKADELSGLEVDENGFIISNH